MNTWLLLLATAGIVIVMHLLTALAGRVEASARRSRQEQLDHLACIKALRGHVEAAHLRAAADRWDSVESKPRLQVLSQARYSPGGPSMPAIWLRDEADRLEGKQIL